MATRLRGDVLLLENELDEERVRRERAETENAELREIWDSEVKGKHKLTEKVRECERDKERETDGESKTCFVINTSTCIIMLIQCTCMVIDNEA